MEKSGYGGGGPTPIGKSHKNFHLFLDHFPKQSCYFYLHGIFCGEDTFLGNQNEM